MPNRKKDSGEGTTAIPVHCPPLMSYVNLSSSLNISVLQSYNLQNREAVLVLFWDDFAPMRGLLELFCPMRHGAMSEDTFGITMQPSRERGWWQGWNLRHSHLIGRGQGCC